MIFSRSDVPLMHLAITAGQGALRGSKPPFSAPAHQIGTEAGGQGRLSGLCCHSMCKVQCLFMENLTHDAVVPHLLVGLPTRAENTPLPVALHPDMLRSTHHYTFGAHL